MTRFYDANFKTLAGPHQAELLEKKSRFVGLGYPCHGQKQFDELFNQVRSLFKDARHIAYAYKFIEHEQMFQRCHDAGEPTHTAGRPILVHIEANELCNVVVFVVRYFGGIKLGKGGLARAYGHCAKLLLGEAAPIEPLRFYVRQSFIIPFKDEARFLEQLQDWSAILVSRDYVEGGLSLDIDIPKEFVSKLELWLG